MCKKSKVKGGRNEKEKFEQYESFKCRFVIADGTVSDFFTDTEGKG
jgi:hypothetical protein